MLIANTQPVRLIRQLNWVCNPGRLNAAVKKDV